MPKQFTDSNLNRFEVRGRVFGPVPHVIIERVAKTGARRAKHSQAFEMLLSPSEAAELIEAMQAALANPEPWSGPPQEATG